MDRAYGCLLGLACGDAVGTTVEFSPRGTFTPLTDMVGGGPFRLLPGQWTDDTSMALCLGTSLIEKDGFDPVDQMERYWAWYAEGYLSSTGTCFDIGNTVRSALKQYRKTGEPYSGPIDPWSAGNGSIMRLAPIPLFYFDDLAETLHYAAESSRTTHGATEAVDGCRLFGAILHAALSGHDKEQILFNHHFTGDNTDALSSKIRDIGLGIYRDKGESEISGSGYVVQSLEAALWSFYRTDTYRDAVLLAANLGDDADTTAAICGQVAGAFYGKSGIPKGWLDRLTMREEIQQMAELFS